ncbi:MAG: class I SAM-dependent methyltransferase [Chloroflexi bacterium]|nr:class I SAM-dependent methyltransferase [Chloroflexota bacterium]
MDDRAIRDPGQIETQVIRNLIDFAGKDVLEVGCGEGRMTWRFADIARSVLAIDPDEDSIAIAREQTPRMLRNRVAFMAAGITDVALSENAFDIAILSWSI